jgi:hypothetical protein
MQYAHLHLSHLYIASMSKNAPPVTTSPFWKLCDLLHLNNQRYSNCMHCSVQDFNLSLQSILRWMFWPFMTGSNKSGEDHVAGTLAFPSILLVYKSLCSSKLHPSWRVFDCFPGLWNETLLLSFDVFYSHKYLYFVKNKPSCILCFLGLLYIFLTGTWQLLETKWVFLSKSWFWCSWQQCSSRVPNDHQHPNSSANVSYFWSSFIE